MVMVHAATNRETGIFRSCWPYSAWHHRTVVFARFTVQHSLEWRGFFVHMWSRPTPVSLWPSSCLPWWWVRTGFPSRQEDWRSSMASGCYQVSPANTASLNINRCSTTGIVSQNKIKFHLFFMCNHILTGAYLRLHITHFSTLLELIKTVLSLDAKIKAIANELYQQRSLLVMGRGFHYATCLEGALVS